MTHRLSALGLALAAALAPSTLFAATLTEDFSSSPAARGWKVFGEAALFHWNLSDQVLETEWDSRKPNSYFSYPLGRTLSKRDDFTLGFDLRLSEIQVGINPGKPFTFQIAAGLIHWETATRSDFLRGTGFSSPNLVEFDYFADSGFGATVAPTIISTTHQFASSFNFPLELTVGDTYRITMTYTAATRTLVTVITRNGEPFGPIRDAVLDAAFGDFQVDHFAVSSYSDGGQDPAFGGSILARGFVDNLRLSLPESPASLSLNSSGDGWVVRLPSLTGWSYTLQRSDDLRAWTDLGAPASGTGGELLLRDAEVGKLRAFYRVQASPR